MGAASKGSDGVSHKWQSYKLSMNVQESLLLQIEEVNQANVAVSSLVRNVPILTSIEMSPVADSKSSHSLL